jgi:anti-anti-sigma factor
MSSHQIAMATSARQDDEPVVAIANESQTVVIDDGAHGSTLASEASFAPASAGAREHTLILTGELDSSSAHALETAIEHLCEEGVTSIKLDLRDLTHIDTIGVAVIAFRCRLCQRRGCDFSLIAGGPMIHRAFEQAGVAGLLPFNDEVAKAPASPAVTLRHTLRPVAR